MAWFLCKELNGCHYDRPEAGGKKIWTHVGTAPILGIRGSGGDCAWRRSCGGARAERLSGVRFWLNLAAEPPAPADSQRGTEGGCPFNLPRMKVRADCHCGLQGWVYATPPFPPARRVPNSTSATLISRNRKQAKRQQKRIAPMNIPFRQTVSDLP